MKLTYYMTLAGLVSLSAALPWWLLLNTSSLGLIGASIVGSIIPLLLLAACLRKIRNWSGITALCMIPYSVLGVMDIVATLGAPDAGMLIGVSAILTFFTVLDAGRRLPG